MRTTTHLAEVMADHVGEESQVRVINLDPVSEEVWLEVIALQGLLFRNLRD